MREESPQDIDVRRAGAASESALLALRARRLARPRHSTLAAAGRPGLFFRLGRERYAIEVCWVCHVSRLTVLALVPRTPDVLLGVTNLRGQLLPVFDLRALYGVDARGLSDMTRLLVIGRGGQPAFGIVADDIDGEAPLPTDLDGPPEGSLALRDPTLTGVIPPSTLLIDGDRLLDDDRLCIKD